MSNGLTFKADSVNVYLVQKDASLPENPTPETNYGTLTASNKTDSTPDITITFDQDWLTGNTGKDIIIRYTGTVNENSLSVGTTGNPNKATINWGNTTNFLHDEDDNKVYNAKIKVIKNNGQNTEATEDDEPLSGAKFKLYRLNGSTREYYRYVNGTVSWVTEQNATEYITNAEGKLSTAVDSTEEKSFDGLRDGTYFLTESFTPSGYNSIPDVEVTIAANNFTEGNLIQTKTVINNKGSVLPTTGGIGTTVFHVAGAALAIGAAVLLISKKRMNNN